MIPKIIHYCWFGKNRKSEFIQKCMNSWKKYCPNYEFIEWNEDNFDLKSNVYVREAYENKKWAFVSDYVRLYVLAKCGGFYLDTDVELIKPLDEFCFYNAFTGYESKNAIQTAVMGSDKNNEWILYLLTYYEKKHFILDNGKLDLTTNVITITEMTKQKYKMCFDNQIYSIPNIVTFFPKEYFAPKSPGENKYRITKNTVAIHHFDGSWIDGNKKIIDIKMRISPFLSYVKKIVINLIGERNFERIRGR